MEQNPQDLTQELDEARKIQIGNVQKRFSDFIKPIYTAVSDSVIHKNK